MGDPQNVSGTSVLLTSAPRDDALSFSARLAGYENARRLGSEAECGPVACRNLSYCSPELLRQEAGLDKVRMRLESQACALPVHALVHSVSLLQCLQVQEGDVDTNEHVTPSFPASSPLQMLR